MNEKDRDKIEAYLYGQLSDEELLTFEQEIKMNTALAEEVELMRLEKNALRLLDRKLLREEMANWDQEEVVNSPDSNKVVNLPRRKWLNRLSVAAAVLLLVISPLWWANRNYNNGVLTNEVLGIRTSFGDRSNIPGDNPLIPVLDLMASENYDEALEQLALLETSDQRQNALLLEAEIYSERKNWSTAIAKYQELTTGTTDQSIRQNAEWLLGNAYLASGQEDKADEILSKIVGDPGHLYRGSAEQLQQKLRSFWRMLTF